MFAPLKIFLLHHGMFSSWCSREKQGNTKVELLQPTFTEVFLITKTKTTLQKLYQSLTGGSLNRRPKRSLRCLLVEVP